MTFICIHPSHQLQTHIPFQGPHSMSMLLLFCCSSVATTNRCKRQVEGKCVECEGGAILADDGVTCVQLGCTSRYCLSCSDPSDIGSSCASCSAGHSSVTITSSRNANVSFTGCLKNAYYGFCAVLGPEKCWGGCELDIDATLETPTEDHTWKCLPSEEEAEDVDMTFTASGIAMIIGGIVAVVGLMSGILIFFLAC